MLLYQNTEYSQLIFFFLKKKQFRLRALFPGIPLKFNNMSVLRCSVLQNALKKFLKLGEIDLLMTCCRWWMSMARFLHTARKWHWFFSSGIPARPKDRLPPIWSVTLSHYMQQCRLWKKICILLRYPVYSAVDTNPRKSLESIRIISGRSSVWHVATRIEPRASNTASGWDS